MMNQKPECIELRFLDWNNIIYHLKKPLVVKPALGISADDYHPRWLKWSMFGCRLPGKRVAESGYYNLSEYKDSFLGPFSFFDVFGRLYLEKGLIPSVFDDVPGDYEALTFETSAPIGFNIDGKEKELPLSRIEIIATRLYDSDEICLRRTDKSKAFPLVWLQDDLSEYVKTEWCKFPKLKYREIIDSNR